MTKAPASQVRHIELTLVCHQRSARNAAAFAHIEMKDSPSPRRRFTGLQPLGDAFLFAYAFKARLKPMHTVRVGRPW